MAKDQILSPTAPDTVDSIEKLFEFIAADTFHPFAYNSSSMYFNQTAIEQILTDLTRLEDFRDPQCAGALHSNDDIRGVCNVNSPSENRSASCTFDDSKSLPNSTTSDVDNEKSFNLHEWIISDPRVRKIRPPKLYEFLRLLLNNPRYTSYASWLGEDESLFKIHKPTEVARMWEKVKGRKTNVRMCYNTFSRGIRHYYKLGLMAKTHTKHTYRFL